MLNDLNIQKENTLLKAKANDLAEIGAKSMLSIVQITGEIGKLMSNLREVLNNVYFDDVKLMYDWGLYTDDEVKLFVPTCITEEEFNEIVGKEG